jgi:RNA polymerase sigma-70 factor (ECF subfamily)
MSSFLHASVPAHVVEGARRGEPAAQASIYGAYAPAVHGLARRLLGDARLAEEVTQDVFVDVLTQVARYRGDGPFGAWVRGIAVHRALTALRRVRLERAHAGPIDDHEDAGAVPETGAAPGARGDAAGDVDRLLRGLDAESRAVVWLFVVEGMPHAKIAARLGRTTSFSKSRLARALQHLRVQWAKVPSTLPLATTPAGTPWLPAPDGVAPAARGGASANLSASGVPPDKPPAPRTLLESWQRRQPDGEVL